MSYQQQPHHQSSRSQPPPSQYPFNQTISFSDHPPSQQQQPYHPPTRGQSSLPPPPPPKMTTKQSTTSSTNTASYEPELRYAEGTQFSSTPPVQGNSNMGRKKSLVKPDRERIDPNHRLWHYREHAAAAVRGGDVGDVRDGVRGGVDNRGYGVQEHGHGQGGGREGGMAGRVGVMPSTTGNAPLQPPNLRRGKSLLAREPTDSNESGLHLFKRGATLRRKGSSHGTSRGPSGANAGTGRSATREHEEKLGCLGNFAPGPKDAWMVYCYLLTVCVPGFVLRGVFGKRTPEAQRAWREKIGLVSIIACLMAGVGFITFGFTQTVCNNSGIRINGGHASTASLVINGYDYDFSTWNHPAALPYFNGSTNPLYSEAWKAGGMDASFMFQTINQNCLGLITPGTSSGIRSNASALGTLMGWYFPCNLHDQNGTSVKNITGYDSATNCHTSQTARNQFNSIKPTGNVYWTWEQVTNTSRNLAVYESTVLDLDLLQWLEPSQVKYPAFFDTIKTKNATIQGKDITMLMYRAQMKNYGACLQDIVRVGFIDSKSIGCVASDVVLYVSLVFIIGVVAIKFFMAVIFGWFLSWRLGNFKGESYQQRMARAAEIENWTEDIYRPAPSRYRPSVAPNGKTGGAGGGGGGNQRKTVFLPTTSRFSKADNMIVPSSRPGTAYGAVSDVGGANGYSSRQRQTSSTYGNKMLGSGLRNNSPPASPMLRSSRSSTSLPFGKEDSRNSLYADASVSNCPFPLYNIIPQPPVDYEPFNFPLVHSICLVTAYSESLEGLRTTLDSLATTDYPNSHKIILVIADGMVKGSGSKLKTPDIVLGMMKDLIIPEHEVEAHSYVAIADGHKRHNMAKVYAGFYEYDNSTVETSKQQRCPIVLVSKVGNPLEAREAKPGNRGKRDSQIVLMSFLQKVMFDERMTTFEYEFFNSIWRVTGISPDRYETVLCVDADTKVFPDSLTRMNACMVHDEEIMGLCGETKIANKSETWVTMIQVFEYYISHHLTKAFESMFGGVTCLPGCFSMYRIKAPKGDTGYWVPILANPDICEHYSENIVDTLHKKNLLLLGEDRYLSTLMLKTFPKRKMVFVPQAVCKTVVPDTFRILLSQRRRWINSTIHNLFELVLVRDLCGTFCFSMQFVVFMELVGTMVLPAAIAFTLYIIVISVLPLSLIPGGARPIISLILLAIILGLPGLLIVITSRKVAYVGWMLIYLLSLPIWNFVLPAYAFWHFDDFSWGSTRVIEGELKEGGHGDKDGIFDSSHIVMKRWVEFERERRWKNGTTSRDSYYDVVQRSSSPKSRDVRDRYSVVSTNETTFSGGGMSDTPMYKNSQSFASSMGGAGGSPGDAYPPLLDAPGQRGPFRGGRDASPASSESAGHSQHEDERWDMHHVPSSRSIPSMGHDDSPGYGNQYPAYQDRDEDQPILRNLPGPMTPDTMPRVPPGFSQVASGNVVRTGMVGTQNRYNEPTENPYRNSLPSAASGYDMGPMTHEPDEEFVQSPSASKPLPSRHSRGYSLKDDGAIPIPGAKAPVRRVAKPSQSKRASSSSISNNLNVRGQMGPPSSTSSTGLPPGAAPAQGKYY